MRVEANGRRARTLATSALFAALIAVGGLISIPISPVPLTLQSLFVYLSVLRLKESSSISIAIYLFMGLAGLPVFAGGAAGIAELIGPRGGFLIGFLAASIISGFMASKFKKFFWKAMALVVCELIILFAGWLWLSYWVGLLGALWLGVIPFIPGDGVKICLALAVDKKIRFRDGSGSAFS